MCYTAVPSDPSCFEHEHHLVCTRSVLAAVGLQGRAHLFGRAPGFAIPLRRRERIRPADKAVTRPAETHHWHVGPRYLQSPYIIIIYLQRPLSWAAKPQLATVMLAFISWQAAPGCRQATLLGARLLPHHDPWPF